MMQTSGDQKQKLNLLKSRRPASYALRPLEALSQNKSRRSRLIVFGVIAGLGFPALAFASQQQALPAGTGTHNSASSNVDIETSSSPETGEDFSIKATVDGANIEATSTEGTDGSPGTVKINGETIPLVGGSVSTEVPADEGGSVDVQVDIEHSSSSTSVSNNSSSTEIIIESSSSTQSSSGSDLDIRGSPRR